MKFFVICLAFISSMAHALETVQSVDVDQYLGRWYQIARKPLWFEPRNCACTQQTLKLIDELNVDVYNSCNKGGPDGELQEIRGVATVDDTSTYAKYTVDFNQPFKGSYWIVGLDDQYRWAVVSDKRKFSLYILSKTPDLSEALYEKAVAKAAEQLDTDVLVRTSHEGCSYPRM